MNYFQLNNQLAERKFTYNEFYAKFGYDAGNRPEFLFEICYELRQVELAMTATELYEFSELCELADVLLETEEG